MNNDKLHTISLFVANKPGVLLRVTIVFARRGFNIESLVVSSAFDGRYSRMTITAKGNNNDLTDASNNWENWLMSLNPKKILIHQR